MKKQPARTDTDFSELIDKFQTEIYSFIYRMTQNEFDTKDIFQETFINAYKAYGNLRPNSNHRAWLYKIATNLSINCLKKTSRESKLFANYDKATELLPTKNDMEIELSNDQLSERMGTFIRTLPVKQRIALIQRKYEGLNYDEIAVNLKCSEDSARANVYQAIRKIRKKFKGYFQ